MRHLDEYQEPNDYRNWIYVGADISRKNWSKIGLTEGLLKTRATSSQNPYYFIFSAFQIIRQDVGVVETALINALEKSYKRLPHFSTGQLSECFECNPLEFEWFVEQFLEANFGSNVTYETLTHGRMSRYRCHNDIANYYERSDLATPPPSLLTRHDYFTGNREVHEVSLGLDGDGEEMFFDINSSTIRRG